MLLVLTSTATVLARQPSQPYVNDTIDAALDECLSAPLGSATTLSMLDCYQTAQTKYEAAIDAAYRTALTHVDSTSAARLRQSQAAWLIFRKNVLAATRAPWTGDRGTIVGLQTAQSEVISLRARILEIDLVWPGFAEGDEPLKIGPTK